MNKADNPEWSTSGFWSVLVGTAVGVILTAALLNFLVDPFRLFGIGLIPRTELNYYESKLHLFQSFDPRPEALIIGSSRIFAFDPDVVEELTGKRCFNFSLPSAKAETFYSVLRIAINECDAPIDTVILGIDPESFHPTMPIQSEARFIPEYAQYFIYHKSGQASFTEKLGLLFTLDQTTESISSIRTLLSKQVGLEKMEFRDDGYSTWVLLNKKIEEGTFDLQARLEKRIRKYPQRSLGLSEFTGLSEIREKYWNDFLKICSDRGIRVFAFIPTFHPELLEYLHSLGVDDIFSNVSDYLESTIEEHEWVFRDYTDVQSFGGDEELFYDEIHMRPPNGVVLLRDLLTD